MTILVTASHCFASLALFRFNTRDHPLRPRRSSPIVLCRPTWPNRSAPQQLLCSASAARDLLFACSPRPKRAPRPFPNSSSTHACPFGPLHHSYAIGVPTHPAPPSPIPGSHEPDLPLTHLPATDVLSRPPPLSLMSVRRAQMLVIIDLADCDDTPLPHIFCALRHGVLYDARRLVAHTCVQGS